jgi:hypothetical protein
MKKFYDFDGKREKRERLMRSIEKEEKGFEGNERMFVANLTFEERNKKTKEKAECNFNE